MVKEVFAVAGGIVVGAAICYGGYCLYKYYKSKNSEQEEDVFAEKLKSREDKAQKLNELIANQTYVELLTAKELTGWFKANRNKVSSNAKMIITTPTEENMRGLGYPADNDLDVDTNIIQLFYDDEAGNALLVRLVNFTDIDSNLQAKLIEQEGMIVVTD
jgi:hypothetical protein